jgi:hypothetical protein
MTMIYRASILAAAATLISGVVLAQTPNPSDTTYCNALSASYRNFARSGQIDTNAAQAMSQCDRNPSTSIPVLERILKANRVPLPSRT